MHNVFTPGEGKRETVSTQLHINSRTKRRINQGNFFYTAFSQSNPSLF